MVDSDDKHDERYARRLKRRNMVVSHQFQRNSCRKNANKKNAEGEVSDVDDEYLNYINTLSTFMDDSNSDEDTQFVDNDGHGHGHLNKNNGVSPCDSLNEVEDPDYKKFLQHLKKDGTSYVLVIKEKNVFFKYEEKDQLSDSPQSSLKFCQKTGNNGANRSLRISSRNEKVESPEKLGKVFDNKKNLLRNLNVISRKSKGKPLSGNQAKESQVPVLEKECNVDCVEPITNKLNRKSNKIKGIGSLHSIERPCKSDLDLDLESDMIDEDYMTFLENFLYKDDQRYPYMTVDGSSTVFEEDDESTSDVEVITIDIDPCKPNCTSTPFARKPFHTMDVDSGKILQSPGMYNRSSFRDRLLQALKRPYDSNEYRRLLQEANCRKAHHGSRNLRNGVKVFELDSLAESYLEQYNEVAMKIQLVENDHPRVLNLLRGFFYWLQNLSHEGSFQPWMDPACLNVLPQPKLRK